MKILSERLKMARKNCNLTQQQVAKLIHLDRRSISAYERNEYSPPLEILIKLAELYNVTTDFLLGCELKNQHMLSIFNKLSSDGQMQLNSYINYLIWLEKNQEQKK